MPGGSDPAENGRDSAWPLAITVMITTYDGAARIGATLRSLAAQTLAADRFEILVIQNGPPCETPAVVRRFAREHPHMCVRIVELTQPGLGHARNVGLQAARGTYLTYVDDDDWVTPHYLEAMLRHAAPDVVPVALVSAQHEAPDVGSGDIDLHNYASRRLLPHAGNTVSCDRLTAALSFNAGKLVHAQMARQVRYDESLRSGEDFVYWAHLLALHDFRLHVMTLGEDAVYCRHLREGSVGRQGLDYDFLVAQRLDCLAALADVQGRGTAAARVVRMLAIGQAEWMNRHLRSHPHDHARTVSDARARALTLLPWRAVNQRLARELTLHATGTGDQEVAAIEVAQRVLHRGVVTDLFTEHPGRGSDNGPTVAMMAPFIDRCGSLAEVVGDAEPPRSGVADYVKAALHQVEVWEQRNGPYRVVYTCTNEVAPRVAAAMLKANRPELRWVAELSACSAAEPAASATPATDSELRREVHGAAHRQGIELPDRPDPDWTRWMTLALADELVLEHGEQLDSLLRGIDDPGLVERVRLIAQVGQHPYPSPVLDTADRDFEADPGEVLVEVGWRDHAVSEDAASLEPLLRALAELAPQQRELIRLHLFTPRQSWWRLRLVRESLSDIVRVHPPRSLLDFARVAPRLTAAFVESDEARRAVGEVVRSATELSDPERVRRLLRPVSYAAEPALPA